MAKIILNGKEYTIDTKTSPLSEAVAELKEHFSNALNGPGATINFDGVAYNIDATKLSDVRDNLIAYLSTIAGSGKKVIINGVEYSIDVNKMAGAVSGLETVFGELENGGDNDYNHDDPSLHPMAIQDGAVYLNGATGVYSEMPATPSVGDIYLYQDYMYYYEPNEFGGWFVALACEGGFMDTVANELYGASLANVLQSLGVNFELVSMEQTSYRPILESINGAAVTGALGLFLGCSALTEVPVLPNGMKFIGQGAFAGCTGLTSIVIPNTVVEIGDDTFFGCTGLTSVTIPSSVIHIGNRAFGVCDNLTSVYITDMGAWCNISFGDDKSSNPMGNGANLYLNGNLVTKLMVPDTVTYIMPYAFCGCKSITSVTIHDGVTSIGEYAFWNCTGLESTVIGDGVTIIDYNAFNGCDSLKSVVIGDSVTSIGDNAFLACLNLESVVIGNSVTRIGEWAFRSCFSLVDITFNGTTAQWNAITKGDDWNSAVPATHVQCSDGQVVL